MHRKEGDITIEGVGEDTGEPEGRASWVGDGSVERGIGNRGRYWPGGGARGIPKFKNKINFFFFILGTYAVSWTLTHVE